MSTSKSNTDLLTTQVYSTFRKVSVGIIFQNSTRVTNQKTRVTDSKRFGSKVMYFDVITGTLMCVLVV